MNRASQSENLRPWVPFAADSMPEPNRPFHVQWHNKDGSEQVYEDESLDVWLKYVVLYGYPDAPRWRYAS
jgi:hypothetical protein